MIEFERSLEPVPLTEPAPADGWVRVEDGLPEVRDDVFFLCDGDLFWCEYDGGWTGLRAVRSLRADRSLCRRLCLWTGGTP